VFYIGFVTAARVDAAGGRYAEGELTLGGASARFQSDLGSWSMRDYEAQWREAIARLLAGQPTSALVTSYRGPETGHHLIWPMWREGTTVHLQERLVLTEQLPEPFDPASVYALVGERVTVSEGGLPISEWSIPIRQLATFLLDR